MTTKLPLLLLILALFTLTLAWSPPRIAILRMSPLLSVKLSTREQSYLRHHYNSLIYKAGQRGEWVHCLELFEELEHEVIASRAAAPNEYTLNALLESAVHVAHTRGNPDRGPDVGEVRKRLALVWERLVGNSEQLFGTEDATLKNKIPCERTLPPVVPDRVSLNTALKQWFIPSSAAVAAPQDRIRQKICSSLMPDSHIGGEALHEAKIFVSLMCTEYKVKPDTATYNSLIRIAVREAIEDASAGYGSASVMAAAEHIVSFLEEGAGELLLRPNVVTYTSLLVGYVQCAIGLPASAQVFANEMLGKAEEVFYDRMPSSQIPPNTVTVSAFANGLLAASRSDLALSLLSAAVANNDSFLGKTIERSTELSQSPVNLSTVRPDRNFFNTVMNAKRVAGDVDGVLELVDFMRFNNVSLRGSIGDSDDILKQKHIPIDVTVRRAKFEASSNWLANGKEKKGPYQIWRDFGGGPDELERKSNAERRAQWNSMTEVERKQAVETAEARWIAVMQKNEKEAKSNHVVRQTELKGIGVDSVSIHTAIAACCDGGRIMDALKLILDTSALPRPSAQAFNPIIHMLTLDETPHAKTERILFDGTSLGDLAKAVYIRGDRWSPSALSIYEIDSGTMEQAWGLFQEMRCGRNVNPDACSLQILMEAHLRKSEPELALIAWQLVLLYDTKGAEGDESKLNTAACNAKLKALASFLRRYDENITLRQSQTDLTLKDIQPGSNAFTHIISARIAAQKETRSREAVLNTMLSLVCRMTGKQLCSDESMIPFSGANTRPNTQTLNAALEVCAMASNMQYSTIADEYTKKVLKLLVPEIPSPLENMHGPFRTQAVRRDATTTRLLIKGSARRGKLVEAFQVAAASPSRTLSDRTYSALLSACLTTGDIDEAVALLERCGIVRLSFDRPIAPSMLSDMLWQVSLQKNNPGTENEIPNSCGTIYLPTLLRLLQALTAKGHENIGGKANRTTELVRLTWAVDILVNQCPGRLNGDSSSKEYCNALDAYIIVAKACLRLGGQPRLLRRVIDAAQKAGFELENRMSLSNGYLRVGEMYNDVVTQGEVLWGSQVAAETVAASVNENLSRLTRAIERKST